MDNLFAAITPIKQSNNAKIIFNQQLINHFFCNQPHEFKEIKSASHTVSFVKYSHSKLAQKKTNNSCFSSENPIISCDRIDNKKQLSALLTPLLTKATVSTSALSAELCNEQLVFSAYKAWGTECFKKIKGSFCAILWDEDKQEVHAAIDAFSGRSLFYLQLEDTLYLASDAKLLAQCTNTPLSINKMAISQWLAGRPDPTCAMFNEIPLIPAGHSLQFSSRGGVSIHKFWDIDPNFSIRYQDTDQYKAHFLDLLNNSVTNRLAADNSSNHYSNSAANSAVNSAVNSATIFCQMSGGMDSTSITALAKQAMDKKSQPLHTLSHRYANTKSCDESSNIADMISTLKLENQHFIELDQFEQITFAQLYPTDFDNPGVVLSPKYHQELQLMSSLGASVLLTGNGGDETCWGHSGSYRSRLFKGEIGVISEVINACDELGEPVVRSLYKLFIPSTLQNLLKMLRNQPRLGYEQPKWLSKEAATLVKYANEHFSNPYSASFNPARHARYHGLKTTSTYNSMRSYQKVASLYGIDVRHPFFDTDIVEFSFAVPEKMLIQGIYPKWLLRQTMQEYLPASVCWNKTKTVFDHHFANLVRSNQHELRQLLSHTGLQDLGLINNSILLKEFDAVVNNSNSYLHVDMLYAILTQLWFQTHCSASSAVKI